MHTLLSHALLRRWGRDYAARGGEAQGSAYEDGKRRSTRATRSDYKEYFDDEDEDQDDGGSDEFKARTARMQEALRVEARRRGNNMTKAYRVLALVHHPDKGGDAENFRALSAAYRRLKQQRGADDDGDGAGAQTETEAKDDGPSEYELQRLRTIARNKAYLRELGIK